MKTLQLTDQEMKLGDGFLLIYSYGITTALLVTHWDWWGAVIGGAIGAWGLNWAHRMMMESTKEKK